MNYLDKKIKNLKNELFCFRELRMRNNRPQKPTVCCSNCVLDWNGCSLGERENSIVVKQSKCLSKGK